MQVATLFNFLFVNIEKVTILHYNNVVSMTISLLFHPFHVAEIKKIKRDILTLLANIILTLSPSQLSCKSKTMSKRIAHGFTFVIMKLFLNFMVVSHLWESAIDYQFFLHQEFAHFYNISARHSWINHISQRID